MTKPMNIHALRLKPGEDPKLALELYATENLLESACVLACVGSLQKASLRFANRSETTILDGKFEILSLSGLFSIHGSHFHISIADGEGRTYGAHLMEGSEIYTTAEIVISSIDDLIFRRTFDPDTGYEELEIATIE